MANEDIRILRDRLANTAWLSSWLLMPIALFFLHVTVVGSYHRPVTVGLSCAAAAVFFGLAYVAVSRTRWKWLHVAPMLLMAWAFLANLGRL